MARAPKLGKTTITRRRAAAAAATLYFQNQGKTWVLLVLPHMAPLILDPYGMTFDAMGVFDLAFHLLVRS